MNVSVTVEKLPDGRWRVFQEVDSLEEAMLAIERIAEDELRYELTQAGLDAIVGPSARRMVCSETPDGS